jgi:CheY-like chemotaxis protein
MPILAALPSLAKGHGGRDSVTKMFSISPILVVDDDPDLRELLCLLLTDAGYRVTAASDGLAALREVEREMPGVVLLDMKMPLMDGAQFAAEFRRRYRQICPLVVVTAAKEARSKAKEIGAEAWLAKPFALEDALEIVRRFERPPATPSP